MNIFIDETGVFKPDVYRSSSISGVGILIIPDYRLKRVEEKYLKIRDVLPKEKGEVKGRLLNGKQIAQIVEILRKNDCLFEMNIIDMMGESIEGLEKHREGQVHALYANIGSEHHENIHIAVQELQEQLRAMPLQLYIQFVLSTDVVARVFNHSMTYYAQRQPKELAQFKWIVDAKDKVSVTPNERWWKKVVMPFLQSKTLRDPAIRLEGANYSFLDKHITPHPEWLPHPNIDSKDGDAISLNEIFSDFSFISDNSFGLELVDILTNTVRRVCMGNLSGMGWEGIADLIIIRGGKQRINVLTLAGQSRREAASYAPVLNVFSKRGRSMLVEKVR